MTVALEYWIATVGPRQAKLWHCWRAPGVQWLAQEQVVLAGTFENGRLQRNGGMADPQFAREAAAWIIQRADADGAGDIDLIAPKAVLHQLREHWDDRWSSHIHEHEGDLSELRSDKVAQHPVFTLVRGLAARRSH